MPNDNLVQTNQFKSLLGPVGLAGGSRTPSLLLDTELSVANNFSTNMKRRSYDRLDDIGSNANPPFNYGSAGRLISSITENRTGNGPNIVRGYIRRSVMDGADPTSKYRLYFMYNPELIQRNYVSYLEQQALDPFNTIYGSNNLVAPPGILDFSFEMFFDRQVENANGDMPRGVLEDFDYFDLVVRGVVPDNQNPEMPDNGVMMINPRNITVVFSPQLSVQGRPYNATVSYDKFDHRMRPIRMRISLSMKVFYIGPQRQDFNFAITQEEGTYTATVPYDESITYSITVEEVKLEELALTDPSKLKKEAGFGSGVVGGIGGVVNGPNSEMRLAALAKAKELEGRGVPYVWGGRGGASGVDCSGLVHWAYESIGCLEATGYGQTSSLINYGRDKGNLVAEGPGGGGLTADQIRSCQKGDLLISEFQNGGISDHVVFFEEMVDDNNARVFESIPQTGPHTTVYPLFGPRYCLTNYDFVVRPAIAGRDTVANIGNLGLRV
jgi:hypothetical protein